MFSELNIWQAALVGFLLTLALETPVLIVGLSPTHSLRRKLAVSLWINAFSYPVVSLVLPLCVPQNAYIAVAEVFAPLSECLLFALAFGAQTTRRDLLAIVVANLWSFLVGYALLSWVGAYGG